MVRRRLVSTIAALSTVLCVVVLALWITIFWHAVGGSHSVSRQTGPDVTDTDWNVFAGPGSVSVMRSTYVHPDSTVEELDAVRQQDTSLWTWCRSSDVIDHADPVIADGPVNWRFHTVGLYQFTHGGSEMYVLELPYLALVVLFALAPAVTLCRRWRRRRAVEKGCCIRCGYDLRVSASVCPECGTPVSLGTDTG